eukprot:scaffold114156_cov23-Tisochrysis_lutea.AAC.3
MPEHLCHLGQSSTLQQHPHLHDRNQDTHKGSKTFSSAKESEDPSSHPTKAGLCAAKQLSCPHRQ